MIENVKHNLDTGIAVLLFVFCFAIGMNRIWETDTWWHLKTGEVISTGQRLPDKDVFSYTGGERPWVNDEWLGDVYLYGIYSRHGFEGLSVAAALAGALIFMFVFGACRLRGAPVAVAALSVAVAAVAARARITPRPDVFALLLFSADLYLLMRLLVSPPGDKKAESLSRLVPVIQLLWVNIHPSGLAGIGLIVLAMASGAVCFLLNMKFSGRTVAFLPQTGSAQIKRLGVLLAASLLVSLINPYHVHALTAPFEFSMNSIYLKHIAEWSSLARWELFSLGGDQQVVAFKVLAVAGILSMIASRRKVNLFDIVIFAATLFMSIKSRRFIAMFAIAAAPMIAANAWEAARRFNSGDVQKLAARVAVCGAIVALFIQQTSWDPRFVTGTGVRANTFPVAAADFIAANHITGNMFNDYGLGGYLIWRLYPANKVFIDGRTTYYGSDFYTEYINFEAAPTPEAWRKLEKKYGIDYAVLSIGQRGVRDAISLSSRAWKTVFWDGRSMILMKESPQFSDIISREGYSVTEPYSVMNLPPVWERLPADVREAAGKELERNVARSADSLLALRALSFIYYKEGNDGRALELALKGLEINPGLASLQALAGNLLLKAGRGEEAEEHLHRAAELDPRYKR